MSGNTSRPERSAFIVALTVLGLAPPVAAALKEAAPGDDVEGLISSLEPGDELVLAGGAYELDGRFGMTVVGTEAAPIVVRAKDGERPHFHRASRDENIVDLDRGEWVTFRGIEFSGGSAGFRMSGATHVTIEDCEIHDTGDVALRANDGGATYDSVRILRNHIHHTDHTGEGMYLGCNSNACQFAHGLIANNHVHHTDGPTVEQGDGIELKEGSYDTVIRDNVIHDTNYPCIITYSVAGNGPPNVIERNLLFRCGDHGIQSAADAVIRNNIILGAASDGIAMQPHQSGAPSNLVVVNNTVLDSDGNALSLRGATGSVMIANNALFTDGATALFVNGATDQVVFAANVVQGGAPGGSTASTLVDAFVAATFSGGTPNDVYPKSGGSLVGAGDAAHLAPDDFNGTTRSAADVGAYAFAASGNPGAPLGEGFKIVAPPIGSGGSPGSGGASNTAGAANGGSASSSGGASNGGGASSSGGSGPSGGGGPTGSGAAAGAPGSGDAGLIDVEGGTDDGKGDSGDDGGCGCRTSPGRGGAAWAALALALSALARRRRRAFRADG